MVFVPDILQPICASFDHRTFSAIHLPCYLCANVVCTQSAILRNERLLNDPVRNRQIIERIPAGRWGVPKDFAGPAVFLASRASQYVCGELLVVDGVSSEWLVPI
jgi:hypothetical protein